MGVRGRLLGAVASCGRRACRMLTAAAIGIRIGSRPLPPGSGPDRLVADACCEPVDAALAGPASDAAWAGSDERYRTIFRASPVGISLSDEHGHFIAVNPAMCRLLGRPESEVLGRGAAEFTHPADLALQARVGELLDASADGILRIEKRFVRPDGEIRWGWLTLTHTSGPVGQTWTLAHMQDTTERKIAEQAVIDSEANLTAITQVLHRVQSGKDPRDIIVNAAVDLSGASFACLLEPVTDRFLQVSASTLSTLVDTQVALSADSATTTVYNTGRELFIADADNHRFVSQAMLGLSGARSLYLLPVTAGTETIAVIVVGWCHRLDDLEDRRARAVALLAVETGVALRQAGLVAQLDQLAHTDPLTGLLNRRGWDERLARLIDQARHSGQPLTVALADLDHFKQFNDSHGHLAGDALLNTFAAAGPLAIRIGDTIARWGGEEFAVALPACPADQAPPILHRLRQSVTSGQTCSIGYATWNGTETADELLRRVDTALYHAKHAGRNQLCAA